MSELFSKPFYFESNSAWGEVRCRADLRRIVRAQEDGGLGSRPIGAAREATWLHPSALIDNSSALPNFGFRREHVGERTLKAWASEHGIDLAVGIAIGIVGPPHAGKRTVATIFKEFAEACGYTVAIIADAERYRVVTNLVGEDADRECRNDLVLARRRAIQQNRLRDVEDRIRDLLLNADADIVIVLDLWDDELDELRRYMPRLYVVQVHAGDPIRLFTERRNRLDGFLASHRQLHSEDWKRYRTARYDAVRKRSNLQGKWFIVKNKGKDVNPERPAPLASQVAALWKKRFSPDLKFYKHLED